MAPRLEPPPQGRERIEVPRRGETQDADATHGSSLPPWRPSCPAAPAAPNELPFVHARLSLNCPVGRSTDASPSTEFARADDLAPPFDHGSPEAMLKRLDGDRVRGQDSHPDELRHKALESFRRPSVERRILAATHGRLAEQSRLRQAGEGKVLDQPTARIVMRCHGLERRPGSIPRPAARARRWEAIE